MEITYTVATKAVLIFIDIYPILKRERLNLGKKFTLYKVLITSVLTYNCPAWNSRQLPF